MISWKKYLENVIDDFRNKGYNFNHIEEKNIKTISNKIDVSYHLYIKKIMHAIEWKLNSLVNKNKSLIKKVPPNWRHPLKTEFESYRV